MKGRIKLKIRKGKRYPYGIHVPDMKHLCKESPIEVMPAPEKVYLCVSQHIGAPAIPCVEVGEHVKKGQLVAKESGFISANVYASVSGQVIAIEEKVNALNQKQKYIVVQNDGENQTIGFDDMKDFSPASIIERIRLAGIVGLGGAGFPTAVKLSPASQLEYLIIHGAECEPYLTCDYRLMIERNDEIYKGIMYTATALNVDKIIVGIEANKPLALKAFERFDNIQVVELKKQYPMGSEKHLIYCTTGKKVPLGKMPFDVGCCVQNIKTMIAVYEAIEHNVPLTETVMTVSGNGIACPKNIRVALGTPFGEIAEFCGGLKDGAIKLVAGGPMMGKAIISTEHFVRKTDSGFLALINGETDASSPTPCINCARCANNCPMRLMPMYIESFALSGDFAGAEKYGAMNCIECGSCAFNCPAKRPLVQSITMAKTKIKEMKKNGK